MFNVNFTLYFEIIRTILEKNSFNKKALIKRFLNKISHTRFIAKNRGNVVELLGVAFTFFIFAQGREYGPLKSSRGVPTLLTFP